MLVNLEGAFAAKPDGAVAAFNVFGYEDAGAVIQAAEECSQPVILMTNRPAIAFMPLEILGPMLITMAKRANVPVCVHLDHSTSIEAIEEAIRCGYTSVMFDGSQLPDTENIRQTRRVVAMARPIGASVEAEIGAVGYADSAVQVAGRYTQPEAAEIFVKETDVDALAVAIGTVHRMTTQSARINIPLLRAIHEKISTPLVIHGSTGVTDADLLLLAENGARKINIGTSLRMAFGNALRENIYRHPDIFDRLALFPPAMEAVRQKAEDKIRILTPKRYDKWGEENK